MWSLKMTKNKKLFAQAVVAVSLLAGCGGGDADENVTRNLFAVGEIVDAIEDDGPVSGDVSQNDAGDNLTYALAAGSAVSNGELVFNTDGTFTYTPNPDFFGTDSVSYIATQESTGDTSTAILTINVENDFEFIEEYGWSLVLNEEFDTATLDENLWTGVNTTIVDGILNLNAQTDSISTLYSVDTLRSGRFEARIQLPSNSDTLSAFSLMPLADLYDGDNALVGVQYDDSGMKAGAKYGLGLISGVQANNDLSSKASAEFNTYAIEWGDDKIRWYFNDEHVLTVDTLNTWAYNLSGEKAVIDNAGPFNQDMRIGFNVNTNADISSAVMLIDYVKVWSCDSTVAPEYHECASNVARKINNVASDRIESLAQVTTPIYTDGLEKLTWHYTDEIVELSIGNNNSPVITEVEAETDTSRGVVIDVSHPEGNANVAILSQGVELIGLDATLNFDLYIDSANTTSETLEIRMETAWPFLGGVSWNVAELELDKWVSYSIPVSEFEANPFIAPDWIGCCVEGAVEGDALPLDTSDVGSLLTIEFFDQVHLQLDNVNLTCTSNESCIQGPLEQQEEAAAEGATPIRIEAEDFIAQSGVELEATLDDGGGENIGFIDTGDFVDYSFIAPSSGTYSINYRLASDLGSDGFELLIDGVVVDTQTLDPTGGWQEWVTQSSEEFQLESGEHTIRFNFVGGAINVNWFEFVPPLTEIFIEAENFAEQSGIELETTTDEGGGENIGYTDPGDFLEYTVNIPSDGEYRIEYRLAGQNDSDGFQTSFNGSVVDTQVMPSTGGWQMWLTQTGNVTLVAGEQTMRIDFIGGQVNINWIKIVKL